MKLKLAIVALLGLISAGCVETNKTAQITAPTPTTTPLVTQVIARTPAPATVAVEQPIGLARIAVISRNRPAVQTITGTIARADSMAPIYDIAIVVAAVVNGEVDAYFDHDSPHGFANIPSGTMRVTGNQAADGTLSLTIYGKPMTISPDGKMVKWHVVGMDVVGTNMKKTTTPVTTAAGPGSTPPVTR